jgi:hypothetical protein
MDQDRRHQPREVQHRNKILTIDEFDFPSPRFDILLREGAIIFKLQGFGVVSILGFNLNLARIHDLVLLITHAGMYTKV